MKVDSKEIEYSTSGKSLGTTINTQGFLTHANNRISLAKSTLHKLYSLIDLSQSTKRLLYLAITRSKLLYPIVPLQTRSKTIVQKMQVVQNRASRIITKTRFRERKTNKFINEKANLEPINMFLNRSAREIWDKMELNFNQTIKMTFNRNNIKQQFPSSRELSNRIIEPKY